jgi:translation initiation factor 2B subunit (eIF-2B alpha/beta/delta family)
MKSNEREILYKLFRDHEDVIGATQTSLLTAQSMIDALKQLQCSKDDIQEKIQDLIDSIKHSEPRIVPLINMISICEKKVKSISSLNKETVEEIKRVVIAAIEGEIEHLHRNIKRVVDIGVDCIEDGDFIIVYSVSAPVKRIIPEAKKCGKNFKVLIIRQDIRKTQQGMKILDKEGVEYVVVPEYGLSHFLDKANKLFLGAIAVTEDGKVVTAAGTSNIISIAHIHKLPVFLFVNSLKFSVKKSMEQNIHKKIEKRSHDGFKYTLISHSHDLVDLNLIDHLVIEEGEIEKEDIQKYRSKIGL